MRINLYADILIDAEVDTPTDLNAERIDRRAVLSGVPTGGLLFSCYYSGPSSTAVTDYHTTPCFVSRTWDVMVAV